MDRRASSLKRIRTLRGNAKARGRVRRPKVKKTDLSRPWAKERSK